jgi:hypothetical protein
MKEFKEKYKIDKVYSYHQIQKDKKNIEFGWVESLSLNLSRPIVISRSTKEFGIDNVTELEDYNKFFLAISGQKPHDFIKSWNEKPEELKDYWEANFPYSYPYQHVFMLKLSKLISEGTAFEMYDRTYEILKEDTSTENGVSDVKMD